MKILAILILLVTIVAILISNRGKKVQQGEREIKRIESKSNGPSPERNER